MAAHFRGLQLEEGRYATAYERMGKEVEEQLGSATVPIYRTTRPSAPYRPAGTALGLGAA